MMPLVRVPETIAKQFGRYRDSFCREAGFEHVQPYVTGLLLSANKTLQGIYAHWSGSEQKVERRAMHAAVFEAGWDSEGLMPQHRVVIGPEHRGQGREVISLDWTLSHHERGREIFGVKRAYDDVAHRMGRFQTVVTATIANQQTHRDCRGYCATG